MNKSAALCLAVRQVVCLTVIAALPSVGFAQNTTLETVNVTAQRGQPSLSGSTTTVLDQDQLQLIDAVHINETLARVAGTWISRGNGQEHLTAIRSPVLTGAGSCGGFLVAEDGLPTRPTGFCNVNQLFEVNTEQAAGIEVLKGPGTVFYGSNALHGIINVISFDPAQSGRLALDAGPDDYQRIRLSVGKKMAGSALGLQLSGSKDGGYKDQSGFAQQKLSLAYDFESDQLKIQNRLHLSNLNQETAGFIQGFEAYEAKDQQKLNSNPEAFRDAQSARFSSRIRYQLDSANSIQLTPYLRRSEMRFIQHYLPGQALEQNQQSSWGLQAAWTQTTSSSLTLNLGLDLEFADAELLEDQPWPTDSSSAFLRATIPQGKHYDYQVDSQLYAAFINAQWQLSDTSMVEAGLRFESVQYDYENKMAAGGLKADGSSCLLFGKVKTCRHWRPESGQDSFDNVSYQLGFSHDISPGFSLYGRLAKSFRAPQTSELYRLQKGQENAQLDSESLQSLELGLRGSTGPLTLVASVYAMEKDNVIFRDSDGFNIDNGKTRHRGVEFEWGLALSQQLSLNGSASYAVHRYANNPDAGLGDINGNDVDTAPRQQWNLRLNWQASEVVDAELEWAHLGRYYLEPQNQHRYNGHDLLNLRARYQLHPSLELSARVSNLLAEDYAERADYSFGSYRYFVGQDRGLYLSAEYKFQ